jgi:hypothetical protein
VAAGQHRGVAGLQIVSVNVSEPGVLLRRPGGDVISSLDKRPAGVGILALSRLGLDGDRGHHRPARLARLHGRERDDSGRR